MSDIDGGRWLSYAELSQALGVSPAAARQHARRRGWQRRAPNAVGAHGAVLVPDDVAVSPRVPDEQRTDDTHEPQLVNGQADGKSANSTTNAQALSAAIAVLRDQLAIATRQIDALDEERRFLFSLLTDRRPWWWRWFR